MEFLHSPLETAPPSETQQTVDRHTARRNDPLQVYRTLADYLVTRRQHGTCANLNATNKAIFRATLPILFRVVTLRFHWTRTSSLASWIYNTFSPLQRARGARYIEYLIDEPWIADDALIDYLQTRTTIIEPIIWLSLPSVRNGRLKATASIVYRKTFIWIHENFNYQDGFVILFQGLFGATFTELELRSRMIIFRRDLRRVWLSTRPNYETGPVFRILWEETARFAFPNDAALFNAWIGPMEHLDAVFLDTLNSLASLSRAHVYLAPGGIQFPALEMENLSLIPLMRILREWAGVLAADEYHACVTISTPAYIAAARRNMNMPSGPRLIIQGRHSGNLFNSLLGEIHIDFEAAVVQWYAYEHGRATIVEISTFDPWPIIVTVTPQATSRIESASVYSDARELPPDVCVWVAEWLSACEMLGTCASLNVVSRQVQFATLPTLYRVLVWKSYSWETTGLNRPSAWDFDNMREYGDEYMEQTRMWRRMITGLGAKYIEFILDFVRDFPHIRQPDREHPAIRASIAMGALPRLKATATLARAGYSTSIHSNFSFGSTDIFSLVASLDKLLDPPDCYLEGYQLVIKRCRRAVMARIGPGVQSPSTLQYVGIYRLEMEFVEGVMVAHGDGRFDMDRLARFYNAAVGDALEVLSIRIEFLSPDSWRSKFNQGQPCYLSLEVPNAQEAKLVAFSLARTIHRVPMYALVEVRIHVNGACTIDDVKGILATVTPVYRGNAPRLHHRMFRIARVFRVTGLPQEASGSLTIGVRVGMLDLRIRVDGRVVHEESFRYEPEPDFPGGGFYYTEYVASPFLL